jgi:hypothetical protein
MTLATVCKSSIAISVALTCGLGGAYAGSNDTYYDLVRPNGQPRDDATFEADLGFCYKQTGASRYRQDTPAFKQCMLARKWRWETVRITRSPSSGGSPNFDSPSPDSPPAPSYQDCLNAGYC